MPGGGTPGGAAPEEKPAAAAEQERDGARDGADKELLVYLEHVARHPFIPALQRDREMGLSRYKGGVLRQRLLELGWVRIGRRSGQLTLLEATEEGYRYLESMNVRMGRPRGRGGFVHRY